MRTSDSASFYTPAVGSSDRRQVSPVTCHKGYKHCPNSGGTGPSPTDPLGPVIVQIQNSQVEWKPQRTYMHLLCKIKSIAVHG